MQTLFNILEIKMNTPTNYGWFHLSFMALIIITTALLIKYFKDCDDRVFRRIILVSWIVMVAFEAYKQFVFTFSLEGDKLVGDYAWYAFPYQLCSTPLYVLPFIAFMGEGKARDYYCSYISTFALFGGIVVFFYPNDVFMEILGINVQTMVHHGLQVVLGVFILVHERKKACAKYFIKGVVIFAILSAIAVALNEFVFLLFTKNGIGDTFNMFYISSRFPVHLPILSTVYELVPYVVYLMAYLVVFSFAGWLMLYGAKGIMLLVKKITAKLKKQND